MRERISAHLCDGQLGDLRMNYHYLSLLLCVLPNLVIKDDGGAKEKIIERMRVGIGVVDFLVGSSSIFLVMPPRCHPSRFIRLEPALGESGTAFQVLK